MPKSQVVRNLASTLQNVTKTTRKSRNRRNRRARYANYPRRFNTRNVARGPSGLLAGYGSPITTVFNERRINDGLVVRGLDLITSFQTGANISYFITANPAAWNGTRIAAIAGGFQNYRPLKFIIHYRPQCGSTSEISMTIGTIWQNNYITARSQIEPSLLTSPGGVYTPAWQSTSTQVNLGRCLPQRMFPVRDPHFTTVPFAVVARASNGGPSDPAVTIPGRIFIEYAYEFRNAIGSGSGFQPSTVSEVSLNVNEGLNRMQIAAGGENQEVSGWIIDYTDSAQLPSPTCPLFAKMTTDLVRGSSGQAIYLAEINEASIPSADVPATFSTYLYSDNGLPN